MKSLPSKPKKRLTVLLLTLSLFLGGMFFATDGYAESDEDRRTALLNLAEHNLNYMEGFIDFWWPKLSAIQGPDKPQYGLGSIAKDTRFTKLKNHMSILKIGPMRTGISGFRGFVTRLRGEPVTPENADAEALLKNIGEAMQKMVEYDSSTTPQKYLPYNNFYQRVAEVSARTAAQRQRQEFEFEEAWREAAENTVTSPVSVYLNQHPALGGTATSAARSTRHSEILELGAGLTALSIPTDPNPNPRAAYTAAQAEYNTAQQALVDARATLVRTSSPENAQAVADAQEALEDKEQSLIETHIAVAEVSSGSVHYIPGPDNSLFIAIGNSPGNTDPNNTQIFRQTADGSIEMLNQKINPTINIGPMDLTTDTIDQDLMNSYRDALEEQAKEEQLKAWVENTALPDKKVRRCDTEAVLNADNQAVEVQAGDPLPENTRRVLVERYKVFQEDQGPPVEETGVRIIRKITTTYADGRDPEVSYSLVGADGKTVDLDMEFDETRDQFIYQGLCLPSGGTDLVEDFAEIARIFDEGLSQEGCDVDMVAISRGEDPSEVEEEEEAPDPAETPAATATTPPQSADLLARLRTAERLAMGRNIEGLELALGALERRRGQLTSEQVADLDAWKARLEQLKEARDVAEAAGRLLSPEELDRIWGSPPGSEGRERGEGEISEAAKKQIEAQQKQMDAMNQQIQAMTQMMQGLVGQQPQGAGEENNPREQQAANVTQAREAQRQALDQSTEAAQAAEKQLRDALKAVKRARAALVRRGIRAGEHINYLAKQEREIVRNLTSVRHLREGIRSFDRRLDDSVQIYRSLTFVGAALNADGSDDSKLFESATLAFQEGFEDQMHEFSRLTREIGDYTLGYDGNFLQEMGQMIASIEEIGATGRRPSTAGRIGNRGEHTGSENMYPGNR
ncbi:hypothetical protein ACFLRA_03185 [Bdellovibrionota bacterium]